MTNLSPTLRSLVYLRFERRRPVFGMDTVGYRFRHLDLTASDGVSKYQRPIVILGGILNTSRTLALIQNELPSDLDTPEAAAAWLSYALRDHKRDLIPAPTWLAVGEGNWGMIPEVRRQREYVVRPRCKINREDARLFRRKISSALGKLSDEIKATVSFNGRVLAVQISNKCIETLAEGCPWPSKVLWIVSADTQLPPRFSRPSVTVSFFDGMFEFSNRRYCAEEAMT